MELRQLEHFIAVAGEMSFSRAAERAHVVQSALSASIGKLERELGVQLFDRSRQQIRLTTAGEEFRDQARGVLHAARLAKESLGGYRGGLSGTIEFGALISYGRLDVAKALGDFHRDHPFVRLRLRLSQSGASSYLSEIVEGPLDVALVSAPPRIPPRIEMRLLVEEPMTFVCRADHELAGRKRVRFADLAREDLIGFPLNFGLRRLIDDAFAAQGVRSSTQYEVPAGFAVVAELVRNGLGTTFMPVSEAELYPDLHAVDLATPVIWQIYLASLPEAQISPAAARLAETLLDAARDLRSQRQ